MKMPAISFLEWQQRFGDEESCVQALTKICWPDGFILQDGINCDFARPQGRHFTVTS